MAFRDLITSDKELNSDPKVKTANFYVMKIFTYFVHKTINSYTYTHEYYAFFCFEQFTLKDLSVKPDIEPIPWLSMLTICEQSPCDTRNTPQKLLLQNNNSPLFNVSPAPVFRASENNPLMSLSEKPPSVNHPHSGGPNLLASPPPPSSLIEKRFGSMIAQSPATVIGSSEKPPLTAKPHITTVVSKDLTSQHESKNVKLPPTAVVKYSIPKVHSSDKVSIVHELTEDVLCRFMCK